MAMSVHEGAHATTGTTDVARVVAAGELLARDAGDGQLVRLLVLTKCSRGEQLLGAESEMRQRLEAGLRRAEAREMLQAGIGARVGGDVGGGGGG